MYFPYLRCKQFELLAIRELAGKLGESNKISPILEPVKKSTSPLLRAIESLKVGNVNFTIIINPIHGEFSSNPAELTSLIKSELKAYSNFQIGVILNQLTDIEAIEMQLALLDIDRKLTLIHTGKVNDVPTLLKWAEFQDIAFNLYPENFPVRRYRGIINPGTKILIDDKFNSQAKNADYLKVPDELFTNDHLYYQEDGFDGFSDYLTIGNDYSETGFLPYAVAIHLTYQKENNEVWIRHFVSDTNDDNTDIAGKFSEALDKLIDFIDAKGIKTEAAEEFRELKLKGHYPGLGSLKKLSIKNHLEIMSSILE